MSNTCSTQRTSAATGMLSSAWAQRRVYAQHDVWARRLLTPIARVLLSTSEPLHTGKHGFSVFSSAPAAVHSAHLYMRRASYATSERHRPPRGEDDTIYALSTASGRAAIAIIRLSGPACSEVGQTVFDSSYSLCMLKEQLRYTVLCVRTNHYPVQDVPRSVRSSTRQSLRTQILFSIPMP